MEIIPHEIQQVLYKYFKGEISRPRFLRNDSEENIALNINNFILASGLSKALCNWIPNHSITEKGIFQSEIFDIVIHDTCLMNTDCEYNQFNSIVQKEPKKNSSNSINMHLKCGEWINKTTGRHNIQDIITLHSQVFNQRYSDSYEILKNKLQDYTSLTNPLHLKEPIGLVENKLRAYTPQNIDTFTSKLGNATYNELDIFKFYNKANHFIGCVHKNTINDQIPHHICTTIWKHPHYHPYHHPYFNKTLNYGFEKPYPFFNIRKAVESDSNSVVITEDIDIANTWSQQVALKRQPTVLSWIGGLATTNDLEWEEIANYEIYFIMNDDDIGIKTAERAYSAASAKGCKKFNIITKSNIWPNTNFKSTLADTFPFRKKTDVAPPSPQRDNAESTKKHYTVRDLTHRNNQQEKHIISNLIPAEKTIALSAPQSEARSIFALDLAISVANKVNFSHTIKPSKASHCLYINSNESLHNIHNKIEFISKQLPNTADSDNLSIIPLSTINKNFDFSTKHDQEWIENQLDESTRLVIIDNIDETVSHTTLHHIDHYAQLSKWAKHLNNRGITLILTTKKNLNSTPFTNVLSQISDSSLSLSMLQEKDEITRHNIHQHTVDTLGNKKISNFVLLYKSNGPFRRKIFQTNNYTKKHQKQLVTEIEIEMFRLTKLETQILHLVRWKSTIQRKHICTSSKYSKTTIQKALNNLLNLNLLTKEGQTSATLYHAN